LLFFLGELLQNWWGPFRLLTSHLFLGGFGLLASALLTWVLLPRLVGLVPRDRGRSHAVQSSAAQGKPTGVGVIFVSIFVLVQLLVMPPNFESFAVLILTSLSCAFGFLDDRATLAWGEYKKGLLDLLICVLGAAALSGLKDVTIWLPFTKYLFTVPEWLFIPAATILLWAAINCTNCTDGVDGLSGTLVMIALMSIGGLLYFGLGHERIAAYFLLPHYTDGANWAIMAFSMVGCLAGYLWYNAHPSQMLMGDAGSRALGFLLGVLVIESGNPFVIFMVAGVLLVNGGTGLVKVALLRFARIAIFRDIRFPLHDHVRHKHGWSNPQVLVRFAMVQAILALVLLVLLLKIR